LSDTQFLRRHGAEPEQVPLHAFRAGETHLLIREAENLQWNRKQANAFG
jgi:hypothetical protein